MMSRASGQQDRGGGGGGLKVMIVAGLVICTIIALVLFAFRHLRSRCW